MSRLFSQNSASFNYLNQTIAQNDTSMNRLSSGKLLWTDSPSTRAIYEKLESHINFLSMNMRNNEDMVSYYSSREGYLDSIGETLQRIRDLIMKRSDSFLGPDDREIIDSEIFIHYEGILRELSWAQFNTVPMFARWMESEDLKDRFREGNFYTLQGIDRIMQSVLTERSRIGAIVNTLEHKDWGMAIEHENTMAFQSIGDADFAVELSNMLRNEILFFSNLFLLRQ